jgi:hypothetical protein
MTTRRQFLRGAVAAAVAASLPGSDGVVLQSMAHPTILPLINDPNTGIYTYKTYEFATKGTKMHMALQRSMQQTREVVARNVLSKIFPETELKTPFQLASLEEIEIEIEEPS